MVQRCGSELRAQSVQGDLQFAAAALAVLRQERNADFAFLRLRGLRVEDQHERFVGNWKGRRIGDLRREAFGVAGGRHDLLHPLRADSAVGELDQLADDQRAAPAADGNPGGHQKSSAADFRDRRHVGAVVKVETFADDIFVG